MKASSDRLSMRRRPRARGDSESARRAARLNQKAERTSNQKAGTTVCQKARRRARAPPWPELLALQTQRTRFVEPQRRLDGEGGVRGTGESPRQLAVEGGGYTMTHTPHGYLNARSWTGPDSRSRSRGSSAPATRTPNSKRDGRARSGRRSRSRRTEATVSHRSVWTRWGGG